MVSLFVIGVKGIREPVLTRPEFAGAVKEIFTTGVTEDTG